MIRAYCSDSHALTWNPTSDRGRDTGARDLNFTYDLCPLHPDHAGPGSSAAG